jgi:hypothetical protein
MFKGNKFHELNSKLGLSENIVVPANPEVYLRDVLVAAKKIGASVLADVATTESETQLIDDGDDDEAIELASVVSSHLSLVSGSDNNSQQQQ